MAGTLSTRRANMWWGMACPHINTWMHVMASGLVNASLCCLCRMCLVLVDGSLKLLKKLINVDKIVLRSNVGHG